MPLHKRKPYDLKPPPSDLRPDEHVFQIRFTKEIFRDYEEYLRHVNLYRTRIWTCKVTGKQNLTYEEAVVSERKATEKVQQFPKEFMGPVLSMVQFSPLRIDELVDKIYKDFKSRFVVNEEALGKSGDSLCPCRVLKVLPQHNKDEHQYEVAWLADDGKKFGTSTESAERLKRKKQPFTRALLKAFIREEASKTSVWVVKTKLARKYKISAAPPDRVKSEEQESGATDELKPYEIKAVENGLSTRKRRKAEDTAGPLDRKVVKNSSSQDVKSGLKVADRINGAESSHEVTTIANGQPGTSAMGSSVKQAKTKPGKKAIALDSPSPLPPVIKYPIEDTEVKASHDDPVFTERPMPSTDFVLPMDCLGNLLMVWDFCGSFSKALHLSPFTMEELEKSLDYQEGNAPLIEEILFALLRTNLTDYVLRDEFVRKRRRKTEVSMNNLKEDVSDVLELISKDKVLKYIPSIRLGNYKQMRVREKLEILQELIDKSLGSSAIRTQLEENIEEHQAIAARKREEDLENSRKKKQSKLSANGVAHSVVESNGHVRDGEDVHANHDGHGADEKEAVGNQENGHTVGWKTKGKRKPANNHSPIKADIDTKQEVQPEIKVYRHAPKKVKEITIPVAEQENDVVSSRVIKKTYQKRKGHSEARDTELSVQEQTQAEEQKKKQQLDREMEKRSIRTSPLGKDRDHNVYWFFGREGRLFVEYKDSRKWGYYSAKEELDALLGSLNPKGVRERHLQKQMEKHYPKISAALTKRSKEVAQKLAFDEMNVRRSVRVRTAPRLTGFLAYVNKLRALN